MNHGDPIRVGAPGAGPPGFADRAHLPAVRSAPGPTLEAVCATREETARAAADRWGARKWYADIEDPRRDPEMDCLNTAALAFVQAYPQSEKQEAMKSNVVDTASGLPLRSGWV